MSIVDSIVGFAQANPFLVVAILFFLYKKWQSSQPWPDFGGRLTKVHNCKEWDELLKPANRLVVIDAYALWCPPCKAAAPVYAKLSEEFTPETCCFAKVDVDEARDVAQRLGISAMPTFKFFKNGSEVHVQQGWCGESKMRDLITQHGAKAAAKKEE